MAKKTKLEQEYQASARAELRRIIPMGSTVYTIVKQVARSGMSQQIAVYVVVGGQMNWVTGMVALALDRRMGKRGLTEHGCGMDMCFHLVNSLSYALHGMTQTPEMTKANVRPGYTLRNETL